MELINKKEQLVSFGGRKLGEGLIVGRAVEGERRDEVVGEMKGGLLEETILWVVPCDKEVDSNLITRSKLQIRSH